MTLPFQPYSKKQQTSSKRIKHTQRQKGDISNTVDQQLKKRSAGICELCGKAWAEERAHLTGRGHIDEKTKVTDLIHVCIPCHRWLDGTQDGIRARRFIATAINAVLDYYVMNFPELPGTSRNNSESKGSVRDG
ncbi:hypothetical protein [Paenibacillus sp. F4]|uniref:hypothetical protein n=1 Tax=Paenibacillus sp. F4 TaxID=357385 RepID=UPI000C9EE199|nr:hypothetical protein [Paenibacillus sp. F4]PNQ81932.1 hypothetical protein C1T21_06570 [Paenibacillus sp. F4]